MAGDFHRLLLLFVETHLLPCIINANPNPQSEKRFLIRLFDRDYIVVGSGHVGSNSCRMPEHWFMLPNLCRAA